VVAGQVGRYYGQKMGLFRRSTGVLLPEVESHVRARGEVYFQDELKHIGAKRRELRLVPDPRNQVSPDTVNIYDGDTLVGWLGVGNEHDNRAYSAVLAHALPRVGEVRVVGHVRRGTLPGAKWDIDLRAPDPVTAATILGVDPPRIDRRSIDVTLTRDAAAREAVARLLAKHGATNLEGARLVSELTPSGKYKGHVRLRCEVDGEVVGYAAATSTTDVPQVFKRVASGPVAARVVIRDYDGNPWSAATALMDD